MRKEYINFLPLCSDRTADMLKTEALWTVYRALRSSGFKGMTVAQICDKTNEPRSTVYQAIRQLEREGYIQGMKPGKIKKLGRPMGDKKRKDLGLPTKEDERKAGKTPKIYFDACEMRAGITHRHEGERENPWGDVIFSEHFYNEIGRLLKKEPEINEINEKIIAFLKGFYQEKLFASANGNIERLLPSNEICPNPHCGKSHEGYEFLKAMILFVATNLLESKEFKEFMKDMKFSH